MVKLYGVAHGVAINSLFFSESISVNPAQELLDDLQRLPKGSKVGIEWFKEIDWSEIQEDVARLICAAKLQTAISYDQASYEYWEILLEKIQSLGLEPVFLENKKLWLSYNHAIVDSVKGSEAELFHEGESDRDYHLKLCEYNESRRKRILDSRKIHEIERDTHLLSAITKEELEVAIVGIGHSDYWFFNKKKIQEQTGLVFELYAKQQPSRTSYTPTIFVRNAEPDSQILLERQSLERAIKLMEQGRIVDAKPDYVGTWSHCEPSRGYFELFIQKRSGETISGTIEDLLGTARFEGKVNAHGITFTKKYVAAVAEAVRGEIVYASTRTEKTSTGAEFYGLFNMHGMRGPF
ncbi:MAG: hypothetical protein Q7K43_00600, partial [Candidatus Woesearchaeota archaeon]|nr:hypothetical protein [Candidatus Woesearchaeota archaeon]